MNQIMACNELTIDMGSSDDQKYSCSFCHAKCVLRRHCVYQIPWSYSFALKDYLVLHVFACTSNHKVQYLLYRCKRKLGKFVPCSILEHSTCPCLLHNWLVAQHLHTLLLGKKKFLALFLSDARKNVSLPNETFQIFWAQRHNAPLWKCYVYTCVHFC